MWMKFWICVVWKFINQRRKFHSLLPCRFWEKKCWNFHGSYEEWNIFSCRFQLRITFSMKKLVRTTLLELISNFCRIFFFAVFYKNAIIIQNCQFPLRNITWDSGLATSQAPCVFIDIQNHTFGKLLLWFSVFLG